MKTFLFSSLLFVSVSASAYGQAAEFWFGAGASRQSNAELGGLSDGASTTNYNLTNGWRFGFRTTLNNWRFMGQEFGYGYNRTQLRIEPGGQEQGMAVHQGFYNFLVYATPEGSAVRPFAAGGGHFNNYTPPGTSVTSGGGSTKIGFNYGAGIKVRVSPILAIRFDYRNYQNGKPFGFLQGRSGLIRMTEVSASFGFVI